MIEHFSKTAPKSMSLEDLQDLRIGESKQQETGCGGQGNPTGDLWNAGFRYPLNGEFDWDWDDYGEWCWTCEGNWGYQCDDAGSGGRRGRRMKIKRKEFKGDKFECCLNNTKIPGSYKIHDGKTCAPEYRDPSKQVCNIELDNYCKDYSRIVEDDRCYALRNSNQTLFNKLMKAHCNWSDGNAKQDKCIDWCKTNSSECDRLNLLNECKVYGLTDNCSKEGVIDIKNKCKVYGILSEQGLQKGSYQCTPASIDLIEADCKKYNLSSCTVDGIDQAQILKSQEELSKKALEESQKQFATTQAALQKVIELPSQNIPEVPMTQQISPYIKDNIIEQPQQQIDYTIYIIIGIILCLILFSSSLISLFAIKRK
jgi:hypothetical protein